MMVDPVTFELIPDDRMEKYKQFKAIKWIRASGSGQPPVLDVEALWKYLGDFDPTPKNIDSILQAITITRKRIQNEYKTLPEQDKGC